jgi:capsular exopolysaccharide synthesis family protein
MRSPSIHKLFRLPNELGLSSYLRSDPAWSNILLRTTDMPSLRILVSGPIPPSPADLLGTPRVGSLLAELSRDAAVVIVDSPPLDAVTDAALLAAHVDAVVLVIATGRTQRAAAVAAEAALRQVRASRIGVVLNRRDRRSPAPEEPAIGRAGRNGAKPDAAPAVSGRPIDAPASWATAHPDSPHSSASPVEERR